MDDVAEYTTPLCTRVSRCLCRFYVFFVPEKCHTEIEREKTVLVLFPGMGMCIRTYKGSAQSVALKGDFIFLIRLCKWRWSYLSKINNIVLWGYIHISAV
jgi:hypothetical protein